MNCMSETELALIDTNILVYAYNDAESDKHKIAKGLLEKCWNKEVSYAISSQNIAEFFRIMTEKIQNPLDIGITEQIIKDIIKFSNWQVINYDENTILKAVSMHKQIKKNFWDLLIIATMIENGVFKIYTENIRDFSQFNNIHVINPFHSLY